MNTKQVCETLKVTEKALRIYEKMQIILPKRQENNYRNYSEDDLIKLRTAMLLKELGFSLKEISNLLKNNSYGDTQLVRSLYLQLKAVDAKITELNIIRETLAGSIDKVLMSHVKASRNEILKEIDLNFKISKERRGQWLDMWGFDNKAVKFDNMVRLRQDDELGLFEKYDEVLCEVRNRIYEKKAKRVIDMGCGTGNLCGELQTGIEVIGIDQSLEMLLQAKKKFKNMKYKIGNFLDEPISENDTDIVVTTYAFHSLNNNEKKISIKNMLKYIKENGRIIIADFMFENEEKRQECQKELINKNRMDLWEVIECKYYTDIEKLEEYVKSLACNINAKHIINYTWIVEIWK